MPIVERAPTARQQQAEARRQQILETALQLFARHGFDGVSTRQIAQTAGIAEGLIFHYFPAKEDLLNAVMETRHSFFGELRRILDQARGQSAADVMPHLAAEWLRTLRREAAITSILFAEAQTNPRVGEALQRLIEGGVSRLAAYLASRVEAGELRKDLPLDTSARMFFSSLIIYFVARRHLPAHEWDVQSAGFVEEMFAVWWYGARAY